MRIRMGLVLVLAFAVRGQVEAQVAPNESAQNAASWPRAFYASLTDPACPVTTGFPPIPTTNELRVLYFPTATGAVIHEPKALALHIAFDDGGYSDDVRTTEFTRRDDGVWQAQVTLRAMKNEYAIYWVEEPGTNRPIPTAENISK